MDTVNEFLTSGKVVPKLDAQHLVDKSPQKEVGSSSLIPPVGSFPLLGEKVPQPSSVALERPEGLKSWSSVVSQGPSRTGVPLEYFPPSSSSAPDDPILVRPPREVLLEGNNLWCSSLVGGFLNSRLPFKLVEASVHKMWDKYGLQKVLLQEKGFFVFKFARPEDRDVVLALGPWYISNKLLILKHWWEGLDFLSETSAHVPVWVKFHLVPMSYWTPKGLSFLASSIGKPITLDLQTEKMTPMSFARICIEISSDSSFPEKLNVVVLDDARDVEHLVEVRVEYQNRPQLCPHCSSFGHSKIKCPTANYRWVPKPLVSGPGSSGNGSSVPILGTSPPPSEKQDSDAFPPPGEPPSEALEWQVVGTGRKSAVPRAGCTTSDTEHSDWESTPITNPLVSKLKIVDEKEGRDLKTKARPLNAPSQKSKKKSKGSGGGSGTQG